VPFHTASVIIDNRDAQEMYGYLEARVEIMKRRIEELERENETLRQRLTADPQRLECASK
jgi:hypothetical protein